MKGGTPSRLWLVALAVMGAIGLVLPSLWMGFYADDYVHQLVLGGELEHPTLTPSSLYDFGTAADWNELPRAIGGLPWWTAPDWSIRFFRPLSSLALRVDHALFGDWAAGYHIGSFVWYALVLVLAHGTWRALGIGPRGALLALVLFAATNGAGIVAGWPANRNTLVASAALLGAVLVMARTRGGVGGTVAAFGLAACACAAKESGVVAFALIAAWVLVFGERGSRVRRIVPVAAGVCAVGFVVGLWAAGFGSNSRFYAAPWTDPRRFAGNVGVMLTAGVARLVVPLTVDFTVFLAKYAGLQVAIACGLIVPLAVWIARRVGRVPVVRFLAVWLVLALVAQGGAPPSDRLVFDAAFASAGVLAVFLGECVGRGRLERRLAWGVALAAGPVSAAAALMQAVVQTELVNELRRQVVEAEVGSPELGERELVVLQTSSGMLAFVLGPTWAVEGGDRGLYFSLFQIGRRGLECTRVDERTLVVRTLGEPFLSSVFERVYTSVRGKVEVGERFVTRAFGVEVMEVEEEGPTVLRLTFRRSLDDPGLRLLADREGRLAWFEAPGVGEVLVLPEPRGGMGWVP